MPQKRTKGRGTKATKTKGKKKGTALAKRQTKALAPQDYGDDADAGFEEMTRDDFAIPFMAILQPLSPQVDEDEAAHVEGAQPGMIFNTVTRELFDGKKEGVLIVPCHRTHHFIEWVPRGAGGGLVNVHMPSDKRIVKMREAQGRFGRLKADVDDDDSNDFIETYSMFALLIRPDGKSEQVVIAFSSTGIKAYKNWMTRCSGILVKQSDDRNVRPPLWAHKWLLTTRKFSNDKGTWHGWSIDLEHGTAEESRIDTDDELYLAARGFRNVAVDFAADTIKRSLQRDDEDIEDESM